MTHSVNQSVIDEFRAHGGRVGGPFEGSRLILLTTTGARSGVRHTTPVSYLPDQDRILVIASAAGADRHPDWFRNLVAHPQVTVEDGVFTYEARAVVLEGAERDRMFARACEVDSGWAEYQDRTERVIPVVALEEIPGPPHFGSGSMGAALKAVHDAFRTELARIRGEVAEAGPGTLATQLRVNCLTACQGLHIHHMNEDRGMFVGIARHHPELQPTLDALGREHERIAELLGDLQRRVSDEAADRSAVLADVDRLTAELEEHLLHEEEQLIPILDGQLPAGG